MKYHLKYILRFHHLHVNGSYLDIRLNAMENTDHLHSYRIHLDISHSLAGIVVAMCRRDMAYLLGELALELMMPFHQVHSMIFPI